MLHAAMLHKAMEPKLWADFFITIISIILLSSFVLCGAMVQFKKTEPERAARTLMQNIAVATSKLSISLKANRVVV